MADVLTDMTSVTDEILVLAKNRLIEMTASWTVGVCWGTCLDLEGEEMIIPHHACHSWVGYAYVKARGMGESIYTNKWSNVYSEDSEQFLTLSCHSKQRSKGICSAEASDAIILWIARESPFSEFVLNRDDEESLLNGGVILLCGPGALTQAQAMWICKVLRYSVEGSKALDTWLTLYKGGVNPLLAVLVCSYVRTIKGATFGFTDTEEHSTVFSRYNDTAPNVAALFKGLINPDATDTSTVFDGDVKAGGKIGKNSVPSEIIQGLCKPVQKDDGWGGKIDGVGADGPELVRRVLEWQHEIEAVDSPPIKPSKNTVFLELDM